MCPVCKPHLCVKNADNILVLNMYYRPHPCVKYLYHIHVLIYGLSQSWSSRCLTCSCNHGNRRCGHRTTNWAWGKCSEVVHYLIHWWFLCWKGICEERGILLLMSTKPYIGFTFCKGKLSYFQVQSICVFLSMVCVLIWKTDGCDFRDFTTEN